MIECEIRQKLFTLVDDKFKNFSSTIVKNNHPMIGVQIPKLRSIAKMICKGNNDVLYLNANKMEYYEEILLQGFVIGYSKINNHLKFDYLSKLIPLISDWSECDCIVNSLKFIKTELDYSFNFLIPYLNCDSQFKNRFAIVCLLNYFLTDEYVDRVLNLLINFKSDFYYVNMAIAWALCECFVKFYDKTFKVFKNADINIFVYNKTIQKCVESFRIAIDKKEELKQIKK